MPFGKKVLVTAAGRDLGRAKAIAAADGEVDAYGRNKENIESLVKKCENIHPVIANLSDWDATREELSKLPALYGVVNNAALIMQHLIRPFLLSWRARSWKRKTDGHRRCQDIGTN